MLGMHGSYEANLAMHDCDLMINIGARFDDRITGRIDAFSPGSKKIHVDIDPASINKNVRIDLPIIGDCGHVLKEMVRVWRSKTNAPRTEALAPWWKQIEGWRAQELVRVHELDDGDQAAARDPAALSGGQGPRRLCHDRSRPAPDVGGAAFSVRDAEPLDDFGWARHDGLWPAGGDRRAGGASGCAGHRHRRRSERADDDAGDVDGGAVRAAGQDLHPQQRADGHGAPVAGAAAWRALRAFVLGVAARFREAGGGLWRRRHQVRQAGRSRRGDQGDDQRQEAGAVRLRRRKARELPADDPIGQAAQRDDPAGLQGRCGRR